MYLPPQPIQTIYIVVAVFKEQSYKGAGTPTSFRSDMHCIYIFSVFFLSYDGGTLKGPTKIEYTTSLSSKG